MYNNKQELTMTKEVKITIYAEVPENATNEHIQDFVDVELCGFGSIHPDNPCIDNVEFLANKWEED